jgi:protein ImuB
VTVISAGHEAEQLGSLRVEVLFAGMNPATVLPEPERLLDTLERWGVRNLRALALLPDIALSERLGQGGVRLQQLARGTASRTIVPVETALIFEEAVELEYPVILLEPLAFMLNRLLEQICFRLGARALATQELRLELQLDPSCSPRASQQDETNRSAQKNVFRRTLRLPVPLLDPKIFLKLLQLDLNAHPPGAPIIAIRVTAEPVRPRAAQGGLFRPPLPEPEKLELTLARITAIVGDGKVGCAELLDSHRPHSFRLQHFTVQDVPPASRRQKSGLRETPSSDHKPAVTALRIFRPPLETVVIIRDGAPSHITCARKNLRGKVVWTAGPWRSSGDWWDQDGWARDEWDIAVQETNAIALYRLVRDLLSGKWFLEGTYD